MGCATFPGGRCPPGGMPLLRFHVARSHPGPTWLHGIADTLNWTPRAADRTRDTVDGDELQPASTAPATTATIASRRIFMGTPPVNGRTARRLRRGGLVDRYLSVLARVTHSGPLRYFFTTSSTAKASSAWPAMLGWMPQPVDVSWVSNPALHVSPPDCNAAAAQAAYPSAIWTL
jgi:hypothetical protein